MSISDWLTWLMSWIIFLLSAMGDLLGVLESYDGLITAVPTVVLVVVTAKYVRLTQEYVRLTQEMVEETKASRGPVVFADLELDNTKVLLLVGNTGLSPAHDLKLAIQDSIPWRDLPRHSGFDSLTVIQTGISYLAPNRILRFDVGYIDLNKVKEDGWGDLEAQLTFKNNSGSQLENRFRIDLKQYLRK